MQPLVSQVGLGLCLHGTEPLRGTRPGIACGINQNFANHPKDNTRARESCLTLRERGSRLPRRPWNRVHTVRRARCRTTSCNLRACSADKQEKSKQREDVVEEIPRGSS